MKPLNCPKCGSPDVRQTDAGTTYRCNNCQSNSVLDEKIQILVLTNNIILCTKCNASNSPSARFCGRCGTLLVMACPYCMKEYTPGISYCPNCGGLMRGVPHLPPQKAIRKIQEIAHKWDSSDTDKPIAPFPAIPKHFVEENSALNSFLENNEIILWCFPSLENEQSHGLMKGPIPYLLLNGSLVLGGWFIATTQRFIYFHRGIPAKKTLFISRPEIPPTTWALAHSEIAEVGFNPRGIFPTDNIELLIEGVTEYYSAEKIRRNPRSYQWIIEFNDNNQIGFALLPKPGWSNNPYVVRFWEEILRISIGVSRPNFDFLPYPSIYL